MKKLLLIIGLLGCLSSCNKEEKEPYDTPFIHIMMENGASKTVVGTDVNNINAYNVYLSSKPLSENLEVNYQIVVGNGLKAGVDFELITKGNSLIFLPNIFDMPIRIRWMPHEVDETKDNTITLRLMDNNQGLTMGLPGPSGLQRELVIEKKN